MRTVEQQKRARVRVLHVIASVAPRYGGPSTAIWPMTAALREVCGFTVEIAATDADGAAGRLTMQDLPAARAGTVHLFKRDWSESFKYSHELGRWLQEHAPDYDVIEAHGHWNYPIVASCRAAHRAGVPYILRPCGMLSGYTWRKSRLKKRIFWWMAERTNVLRAAGFHVTSREEREEVLRLGVTVPVEIIPPGIENEAWVAPVDSGWLRRQCPQAGDRPIVLFLSRLHPKKGIIDFLLPAFAKLQTDAYLAMAGGEDPHAPGYAKTVEKEIHRLGLRDHCQLLGQIPPQQRWQAFDGATLFILPSHTENFGFVVAEAMARGSPVIVTTGVQFAEHVTASEGGTIVPTDAAVIASTLDSWLADLPRLKKTGESGRDYIRETFTWRKTAEHLATLYQHVLAHRR